MLQIPGVQAVDLPLSEMVANDFDETSPRLSRAEYWLLESAISFGIPLFFLAAESYGEQCSIEQMFNKPGHGLALAELADTLDRLFRQGVIEASLGDDPVCPSHGDVVSALSSEIGTPESRRSRRESLSYRLTQRGGAVWEAFAAPNWENFLSDGMSDDTVEVTAVNPHRLSSYIDYMKLGLWTDAKLNFASLRIEQLSNWEALYWKRLPTGFRATLDCKPIFDPQHGGGAIEMLAASGMCQFRDSWFRRR